MTDKKTENYKFFSHTECEFFPCHKTDNEESFNCLFCYCPLYALGKECGGNFSYTENGISRSLKREGILSKISGKGTLFTDIISGSALLCFNENNFKSKAEKQRRAFDLNFELSMISSYYEGQIWEPYYQKSDTAVSTVSVIQKAAEEGTKLLFIGSGENTASEIDFSGINSDIASMVRKDIDTFTAKNYIIMIPQKPVKIGNWTG